MEFNKYRIVKFYSGKYGYPKRYSYYELQRWNPVYDYWYNDCSSGKLDILFIKNECLFKKLDFNSIPKFYIDEDGKITELDMNKMEISYVE